MRASTSIGFSALSSAKDSAIASATSASIRPELLALSNLRPPAGSRVTTALAPCRTMITLYSYPELFGVADNNGYGLKVFAFLRLTGVPFQHEHIFDASAAPRGQLPYIVDDGETIGDSDTIIAHLIAKYCLSIDAALTPV